MTRKRIIVDLHLIVCDRGKILMGLRKNTGFCDGMYSVPAGHVMQRESILEAAAREAYEEVGLGTSPKRLLVVGTMHRRSTEGRIDFFVEAERWSGDPRNMELHKCDEVDWFPTSCLPSDTIPYIRHALLKIDPPPWFEEYQLP